MYRSTWSQARANQLAASRFCQLCQVTRSTRPSSCVARRAFGTATRLGSHPIGSGLASGESLHLLEGLAEFKLNWCRERPGDRVARRPGRDDADSEGMPTLRFGRLTATISTAHRPFVLETPVGRLVIAEYGSIGVSAFGNEGEIHVFDGTADFGTGLANGRRRSDAAEDRGRPSHSSPAGRRRPTDITHHSADPDYFAAQVSMTSDGLAISPAYVSAVKKAKPIGYWRFERDEWPLIAERHGRRTGVQINGAVGRTNFSGNQALEFGVTDQDGEIVSDQRDRSIIHDSYSIEFWVKPSHYHLGAMISLVGDKPMPSGILPHGMLIELGGTGKIPTATHHPGCIRFLHRSPASNKPGNFLLFEVSVHIAEVAARGGNEGRPHKCDCTLTAS